MAKITELNRKLVRDNAALKTKIGILEREIEKLARLVPDISESDGQEREMTVLEKSLIDEINRLQHELEEIRGSVGQSDALYESVLRLYESVLRLEKERDALREKNTDLKLMLDREYERTKRAEEERDRIRKKLQKQQRKTWEWRDAFGETYDNYQDLGKITLVPEPDENGEET